MSATGSVQDAVNRFSGTLLDIARNLRGAAFTATWRGGPTNGPPLQFRIHDNSFLPERGGWIELGRAARRKQGRHHRDPQEEDGNEGEGDRVRGTDGDEHRSHQTGQGESGHHTGDDAESAQAQAFADDQAQNARPRCAENDAHPDFGGPLPDNR